MTIFLTEFEVQRRQELNFSLETIGKTLFTENPLIIKGIMDLEPSPLEFTTLTIMRANKDASAQGCLQNFVSSERRKASGDSVNSFLENLCQRFDCDPKTISGIVVFMEPGVTLESIGRNFREIIGQLSPETRLWFVEPHETVELTRMEKERRKDYLSRILKLVDCRSVGAANGLCYSTGKLPVKKRTESATPSQAGLELSLQK